MELVKNVFAKHYDCYFLFLDNEIAFNNVFFSNLKQFSKKIQGNELTIELVNLRNNETYRNNNTTKFINTSTDNFDKLSQIKIDKETTFDDLLFEFTIYDDTRKWEIYCDIGSDYGLGGCNNRDYNLFLQEIKPYLDMSYQNKIDEICQTYSNEKKKSDFINYLTSNYNFQ